MSQRDAPDATTWEQHLVAAASEHDVVSIARDFVRSFRPEELAKLPEECRPGKIYDGCDITTFAFDLVRHKCKQADLSDHTFEQVVKFFSAASARVSEVLTQKAQAAARQDISIVE